ncbi:MAG: DinB family protein [Candidatus Cyclobacteriaceae bacterium M3_2C_046]
MNHAFNLSQLVQYYYPRLSSIHLQTWIEKPKPEKWSKLEILGHLIDSALNNHRRFLVSQYENSPKVVYQQHEWVHRQKYQQASPSDLIELWKLLNLQIIRLVGHMKSASYQFTCEVGNHESEIHSLAFLVEDYMVHMRHHLDQILDCKNDVNEP